MVANILSPIALTGSHYSIGNAICAYEKDGKQQISLMLLTAQRIEILATQWKYAFSLKQTAFVYYLPLLVNVFFKFIEGMIEIYFDPQNQDQKNLFYTALFAFLDILHKINDLILDNSNLILNSACFASYILMIAYQMPITGIIGLFGLLLMSIKRYSYLPLVCDHTLEILGFMCSMVTVILLPVDNILSIIIRVFSLVSLLVYIAEKIGLQDWIKTVPGQQIVLEIDQLSNHINDQNFSSKMDYLYLNPSYVYAPEVDQILALDFDEALQKVPLDEWISKIEKYIEDKKIVFSHVEKIGWIKITQGFIGYFEDVSPPNFEQFQRVMKALFASFLNDEESSEAKIRELANLGNSCTEGWTREINYLLKPITKNWKWCVHHHLARLRQEILQKCILDWDQEQRTLNLAGNNNNIHLLNVINLAFWPRMRTYSAELLKALNGFGFLDIFFINYNSQAREEKLSVLEYLSMIIRGLRYDPAMSIALNSLGVDFLEEMIKQFNIQHSEEALVQHIYNCIYEREIEWDIIVRWQQDFSNRYGINIFEKDECMGDFRKIDFFQEVEVFNEKTKKSENHFFLTKKGVKLLLWDLGVIS
jgi:hypothetical protein